MLGLNIQHSIKNPSLIAAILLSISCGKNQGSKDSAQQITIKESPEQIQSQIPETKIELPNFPQPSANTPNAPTLPPGVGAFVSVTPTSKDESDLFFCTATLINDSHVITAGHCLPDDMSLEEACKNINFVHASDKNLKCEKILFTTSSVGANFKAADKTSNPVVDIAIFKINRSAKNIQSHTLSKEFSPTFNNNSLYSVLAYSLHEMNYANKRSIKELEGLNFLDFSLNFAAYSNCGLVDSYDSGYSLRTLNCNIVQGNSGAPVFNTAGEIQGIIGGCIDAVDGKCHKGNDGGYMTDIGCLNYDGTSYSWNTDCHITGPVRIVN